MSLMTSNIIPGDPNDKYLFDQDGYLLCSVWPGHQIALKQLINTQLLCKINNLEVHTKTIFHDMIVFLRNNEKPQNAY